MGRLTIWACAMLVSASVYGADWPAYRGPELNGISPETPLNKNWAAKTPKELWRVSLGDNGYNAPAIVDGVVYVIDHKGNQDIVRAIDAQGGKDIWTFAYEDSDKPLGSPAYGFTRPSPAVADGKVYTISGLGKLHCLDAHTGKLVWKRDFAEFQGRRPTWAYSNSPVVHGGKLIVCPGGPQASLAALDPATGATIWTAGTDGAGYSTPVPATIDGVEQYVFFSATAIGGYASQDGKKLWSHPWKTSYDVNAAAPLILENAVFISSGYNVGCAVLDITPEGVKERWKSKVIQEHFNSGVLYQGMLYSTTDPGDLVCVDPRTGEAKWRQGGFEKGGIVAADGVILALSGKSGELVMVQLQSEAYKELGRIKPLAGQCWTAPVIAEGKVFARDLKTLVCLDLR